MDIVCAGEVMVEMAPQNTAGLYLRGFAGDSFNTAVYLARAGLATRYLTRLGDDPASREIVATMTAEGIDSSLIDCQNGGTAGLYLIDNDANGERSFSYYREHSPARTTFDQPIDLQTQVFYFTGISLAVMRSGLANLCLLLETLRHAGSQIVFDPNYRPALWRDAAQAQHCYLAVLPYCDTLLPTLDDDRAIWKLTSAEASIDFYRQQGAREIVVKGDSLLASGWLGGVETRIAAHEVAAVDTTGAGDAFNAGYLSARLSGLSMDESILAAQSLAAKVVQQPGAILPRNTIDTGNS